jgi:hypothetical protein
VFKSNELWSEADIASAALNTGMIVANSPSFIMMCVGTRMKAVSVIGVSRA